MRVKVEKKEKKGKGKCKKNLMDDSHVLVNSMTDVDLLEGLSFL